MRYPESKIKELILHSDLDVRDAAIRYFYDSVPADRTLMPLAIEAIERFGRTDAFSHTHYLNVLLQTEQTIGWVIAELDRDFASAPAESYFYYLNLSRLLCHADVHLVVPHAQAVLQARHFIPQERTAFQDWLELVDWNAEKCWQELRNFGEKNSGKNNVEEVDIGHALRIVAALARQPHEFKGPIVDLLSESNLDGQRDARKWLQPLLACLAGSMRLHEAIPSLVANLDSSNRFLADKSIFALAKIGSDDVVAAVCARFRRGSLFYRLQASNLLCKIHLDATVESVLQLLPDETELGVSMNLCEALLNLFSDEGAKSALQFIMSQRRLTPDLRRLRRLFMTVCKVMDIRFPEYDSWQVQTNRDFQEELAKMRDIEKMAYEAGGDMALLARKMQAEIARLEIEKRRLQAKEQRLKAALNRETQIAIRPRPQPTRPVRIGRNDPCQCGSGKKFKVCCMRR